MALARSPLAPERFPDMPQVPGVRLATRACGVRYTGRSDVALIELAEGSSVAGVFTRSLTASAPVDWCRRALKDGLGHGRAILVNAGNANAFTGRAGEASVTREVEAAAMALGCAESQVFVASTGVIGEVLPDERITDQLGGMIAELSADGWEAAAQAIMTTDTFAKGAAYYAEIDGNPVKLAGIAKGSGMIAPDMATMLAFAFTDANLPPATLQALLREAADRTFNCITVDGDTSTSDTLLLAATGKAGNAAVEDPLDHRLDGFRAALEELLRDLAQQVVRDGEGARKFVTIRVAGAADDAAARRIGLAIGNSPLVKTAIAGEDANWGRIVMAVGKAGERADRDRLAIRIGGVEVARDGQVVPGYDEAPVARHMQGRDIEIAVDVGIAGGRATVWTCDLTHAYIDINADYRS
ncbi:bifunctional glutamate N-acetyltransferase/amino-acid acetyltransferase ArgJ [Ferruginivarius sediminum]|uniref:Arginine biosynthesis bifunctional protein ArgJ n=1 Tax=Ferruginivarius sediminum TaxID=2661937 RepID=A0A369T917_9PROT|nr:bifunctional glutamate N-acetyltransferase/amino-acid acetyltransferase ArgJ [Ferruginivarius sediminum]RDD60974.1 bifunctional glutamate N-acetyltransferase/amino-acid acetyltransferase ArgJ [Ferruginivarius sediminum]